MEQGWSRDGVGMEQGWRRDGAGMEQGWSRDGAGMEQGCSRDGAGMAQGWSRDGAGMEQGWRRDGAGMEQGWRSGESTRLPPMWPGFDPGLGVIRGLSLLFVLVLAPRGFSPGTPVFPSPQKIPNSNSIWKVSPISALR